MRNLNQKRAQDLMDRAKSAEVAQYNDDGRKKFYEEQNILAGYKNE